MQVTNVSQDVSHFSQDASRFSRVHCKYRTNASSSGVFEIVVYAHALLRPVLRIVSKVD